MPFSIRSFSPLVIVASLSAAGCLPPVGDATNNTPPVESKVEQQEEQRLGQTAAAAIDVPEGFTTTASGLNYKIIKPGSDKKPKSTDTVLCHYRGTLPNGTEFDSSYARNEPAQFPLNGVIGGWTEGLQLIGEGGEIDLIIPSHLGYGSRGAPPDIPPHATLHFKVELIRVR